MYKTALILVAALLTTGCQQRVSEMSYTQQKAFVDQMVLKCAKQGFGPTSGEHEACVNQEIRREAQGREDAYRRAQSIVSCHNFGYTTVCS